MQKINQERREEEEKVKAALADKDCPPGCVRMPESERVATLNDLHTNKREITNMLEKMPISMRTQQLENKQKMLEQKLNETEKAIEMFSKKVVYVAMDQ